MWKWIILILVFVSGCQHSKKEPEKKSIRLFDIPDTNGIVTYNSSCIHYSFNQNIYPCFGDTLFFDRNYNLAVYDALNLIYCDSLTNMLPLCLFSEYEEVKLYERDLPFNYFYLRLLHENDTLIYFIRICNGESEYSR